MANTLTKWALTATALMGLVIYPAHAEVIHYTENTDSDSEIALGYPVPIPVDSLTGVDGFRSYASLFAQHQDLMLSNDDVAGQVVGTTHNDREIWAYVIGDPDDTTTEGYAEPAVMMNGTIHAREWQSPEVVTELFEYLVATQDENITRYLLDNLNIVLMPVMNVDGFLQTQRFPSMVTSTPADVIASQGLDPDSQFAKFLQPRDGRMRRKNMPNVDEFLATEEDRLLGVDLNRNNDQFFGNQAGNSDPDSLIYGGSGPASEPESQALRAAASLAPENRLRLYIDAHSFSQVLFMPLTNTTRQNTNSIQLANKMVAATSAMGTDYFPIPSEPGEGIATTADFFAFEYNIPAWTLEIEPSQNGSVVYGGNGISHDGFVLPEAEIARAREVLVPMHIVGFYHQAGPPHLVGAQIVDQSNGELVYDAFWNAGPNGRSLEVSTDAPLAAGNEYTLWLGFNKPMRSRTNGVISNYAGQSVTLPPTISITGTSSSGAQINQAIDTASTEWLNQAGGAPSGFHRYADDALALNFILPATLPIGDTSGITAASLRINVTDMTGLLLDGDPSTPVDWENGGWTGYENANGIAGDSGGADTQFTISLNNEGQAQPSPSSSGGGGGGASAHLFLLIMLMVFARRITCVFPCQHDFSINTKYKFNISK